MATVADILNQIQIISDIKTSLYTEITAKKPTLESWGPRSPFKDYDNAVKSIDTASADIPKKSKFAYSTWDIIPDEILTYIKLSTTTDCSNMFSDCVNLVNVGTSQEPFEIPSKSSVSRLFAGCYNLQTVHIDNAAEWQNCSRAFQGCAKLNTISFVSRPSAVTSCEAMFEGCTSLTSPVSINMTQSAGVDCDAMYKNSGLIGEITSSFANQQTYIKSAEEMFQDCAINSVGDLYLANCVSCRGMFQITNSAKAQLQNVGALSTQNCTNMNYMFAGQSALTTIASLDMKRCQTATAIFQNCNSLKKLCISNLGGNADMTELDLSDLTAWDEGLNETVDEAADRTSSPFTLKLSATTKSALSSDQFNTLESLGYTII